jgi:hypothetical protein
VEEGCGRSHHFNWEEDYPGSWRPECFLLKVDIKKKNHAFLFYIHHNSSEDKKKKSQSFHIPPSSPTFPKSGNSRERQGQSFPLVSVLGN